MSYDQKIKISCLDDLPLEKSPFLPPKNILKSRYTLVLDLDETLIHFVSS